LYFLVKDYIDDATAGTSTSDIIDRKKTQEKDTRLQYWRKMFEKTVNCCPYK
jgi:hypothetical protein